MGLMSGIETARPSAGGVYFKAGLYPCLKLLSVKAVTARSGDIFFAVETEIVQSMVEDRPAGMKVSWLCNKRHDNFLGDVRAFVAAALGLDIDAEPHRLAEVTEEVSEAVLESDVERIDPVTKRTIKVKVPSPLAGTLIRLEATTHETKKGGEFTRHRWSPYVGPAIGA